MGSLGTAGQENIKGFQWSQKLHPEITLAKPWSRTAGFAVREQMHFWGSRRAAEQLQKEDGVAQVMQASLSSRRCVCLCAHTHTPSVDHWESHTAFFLCNGDSFCHIPGSAAAASPPKPNKTLQPKPRAPASLCTELTVPAWASVFWLWKVNCI